MEAMQAVRDRLAERFADDEVKFRPQNVKGNRALAIPYISARSVAERLDDVFGVNGWWDDYVVMPSDSVVCRLTCLFGEQEVTKTDVGSPSEQPDAGDRVKASFSDALKRAAVKFGIGRYLYELPPMWADYDPTKRQFVGKLVVPGAQAKAAAKPSGARSVPPPPPAANGHATAPASPQAVADGKSLKVRLIEGDKKRPGLLEFVVGCGKTRAWSPDPSKWKGSQLDDAVTFGKVFLHRQDAKVEKITPEQAKLIHDGIDPAGPARLEVLARVCRECDVYSADDMTQEEADRVVNALMADVPAGAPPY